MGWGRPTKFEGEKTCERVREYLASCSDFTEVIAGKVVRHVRLPKLEGVAIYLGVSRDTVHEWRKTHPAFSDAIEELLLKQACALIDNGLAGHYSPVIAKILLSKFGYRESVEYTGADGGALRVDIVGALDRVYGKG
ncbi:MAG: terminase small subunit [Gammaproteobacteria bacterium]